MLPKIWTPQGPTLPAFDTYRSRREFRAHQMVVNVHHEQQPGCPPPPTVWATISGTLDEAEQHANDLLELIAKLRSK